MGQSLRPAVVLGPGAMGLYLAAALQQTTDVLVVGRRSRLETLRLADGTPGVSLSGLEVRDVPLTLFPTDSTDPLPERAVIWLAIKATQLSRAIDWLQPRLQPGSIVVACQNGLGIDRYVAERLPHVARVRAAMWIGTRLEGPSEVFVAGKHRIDVVARPEEVGGILQRQMLQAGLSVQLERDVTRIEWRKSLWNLAVAGVAGVLDAENGVVLTDPDAQALASALLAEALAVAAAEGVSLGEEDIAPLWTTTRNTASNIGSLVQDLRSGRQTETEWLHGAVVSLGAQHGIAVPAHQTVLRLLRARERRCGIEPGDPVPVAALL
jgi:2-dehydropantoate 2-reductase